MVLNVRRTTYVSLERDRVSLREPSIIEVELQAVNPEDAGNVQYHESHAYQRSAYVLASRIPRDRGPRRLDTVCAGDMMIALVLLRTILAESQRLLQHK